MSESTALTGALHDHFLQLYAIALSDLHLDPTELEALYEIGTRRGVSEEQIKDILLSPLASPSPPTDSVLDRVERLYDFALMVQADGVVEAEEHAMLVKLSERFGFDPDNAAPIAEYLLDRAAESAPIAAVLEEAAATL